jgi:hypothetical protein
MRRQLVSVLRWVLFVPVALIQAGAFLKGEFLTGITGLVLALFLTFHRRSVSEKLGIKYGYVLLGFIVLFLVGSHVDSKYM